jgi:rare lipoprotein A
MCASIGDARANSNAAAVRSPPANLAGTHAVTKHSAAQSFASCFDNLPALAILNVRADSFSLDGITGSVPVLQLAISPPKPILLTSLTSVPSPASPATDPTQIVDNDGLAPALIVGIASMYDPLGLDKKSSDGLDTASGELYDQTAWTAAIRIDLRARFDGVRFGKNYKPAFALVETANKRAIVRVNDVGPLAPGRIIDLNVRSMRYFDPTLDLGLLNDVRVTPLPGANWTTGPVGGDDETILVGSLDP